MPAISTTSLANGGRVELSTTEPVKGSVDLVAQLYDVRGALVRTITVDKTFSSDGTTGPASFESFSNYSVVGLSGGGFAVAYDDTVIRPPGGSNRAEVRLYDAAGGALGSQRFGTDTGFELYPSQGAPQLAAAADGGVFMAIHQGYVGQLRLFSLGSDGAIKGSRPYDARPSSIYDAGGQVVVTLAGGAREVLTHALSPVSSTPVVETRGTEAGEILTGGSSADLLFGQGGDDTLQGSANFDSLTGGPGHDKFVLAVDGSVDQITDFDAAQDTLALVDANGAPINSATGILTFWRGSGVLTYDPDGDQGPAEARSVAVLPGVKTLTQANFAAGYEPALLRIQNPITPGQTTGSHSDVTFGYGRKDYVSGAADYSPAGTLLTYTTIFANGTSSMRWLDTPDAQPWETLVADYDKQGRVSVYATYDDDGSHVLWRYDTESTQTWQRIVDHFDAQGRITSRDVVSDDGSRYAAIFDVAGTQPWGYAVETFAINGAFVGRSLFNDDGTPFG